MRKNITDYPGLDDFKDSNIQKSYESIKIEKAKKGSHHSKHKYLKIVDGKYIYDESKMTSKDHEEAAKFHEEEYKFHDKKESNGTGDRKNSMDAITHGLLSNHHEKLAKEKAKQGSHHSKHKYLKIVDGKYIYDYGNMNIQDHINAKDFHEKKRFELRAPEDEKEEKYHKRLSHKHGMLAQEKKLKIHKYDNPFANGFYDMTPEQHEKQADQIDSSLAHRFATDGSADRHAKLHREAAKEKREYAAKEKVESEKSGEKENGFSNEAKSSFDKFLLEINDLPEQKIKEIMGDDYIDTPGYNDDLEDYDDIQDKMLSQMGEKDFEKLESWYEKNVRNKDLKKSITNDEAFNILNIDLVKGEDSKKVDKYANWTPEKHEKKAKMYREKMYFKDAKIHEKLAYEKRQKLNQ